MFIISGNIYTPEELSLKLQISKYTVYELIKRGEIIAFKVGNKMRIDEEELEAFKRRSQTSPSIYHSPGAGKAVDEPIKIMGSHDFLLEHLLKFLTENHPVTVFPSYIGSLEGLMQLYRGHGDIAAIHLMNTNTFEFNLPFIKQLFIQESVTVIRLAARMQGFIVNKGNPFNIYHFEDISNQPVNFINRQRGSGTRMLFDHYLAVHNINPSTIKGYNYEAWNHLETASEVKAGRADVAFGIKTAADKLGLDFIPVTDEKFDLVFRWTKENSAKLNLIKKTIQSHKFGESITNLNGYDTSEIGRIIYESGNIQGELK